MLQHPRLTVRTFTLLHMHGCLFVLLVIWLTLVFAWPCAGFTKQGNLSAVVQLARFTSLACMCRTWLFVGVFRVHACTD